MLGAGATALEVAEAICAAHVDQVQELVQGYASVSVLVRLSACIQLPLPLHACALAHMSSGNTVQETRLAVQMT